jgi:metal-sulfur cluster biosynthetic enzyme
MSETLTWTAEQNNPDLAAQVKAALREVVDPELGMNIIELGLIRDLELMPDRAHIKMILTTPFCPYGPAIMEETRKKVATTANLPATIEMTPEMWSPELMEEGAGADWGLF